MWLAISKGEQKFYPTGQPSDPGKKTGSLTGPAHHSYKAYTQLGDLQA